MTRKNQCLAIVALQITLHRLKLFCSHNHLVKLIRNVGHTFQAIMFWLATTLQSSIHHSDVCKMHCLAQTSSMETDRQIRNSLVRLLLAPDSKREEIQISDWSLLSPLCHTILQPVHFSSSNLASVSSESGHAGTTPCS